MGQGLLIVEDSRSHSDTPHSVGLLWTSDHSAFKCIILLGVLCSRIVPYFSVLILNDADLLLLYSVDRNSALLERIIKSTFVLGILLYSFRN